MAVEQFLRSNITNFHLYKELIKYYDFPFNFRETTFLVLDGQLPPFFYLVGNKR